MKIFKGFALIGALSDNAPGVVAPVGELSKLSRTVSKEITEHVHGDFPEETLIGFGYKEDDVVKPVTDTITYSCLTAVNWSYQQAKLNQFDETKDSYQQKFILKFGDKFDFVDSGAMVQFGTYWAPEFIIFGPKDNSQNEQYRIWFADVAFFNEFDEYEIVPVVPLIPLDQFFNDFDTVSALIEKLNNEQQSELFDRISDARGVYPETYQRLDVFAWQDANNHALKVNTNWITLIYGAAGNNLDSVKEELVQYILANSTHTRDEWAEIFPDIFTSTEFIIVPMWDNVAIPGGDRQISTYSGILQHVPGLALAQKACKGVKYTDAHIASVICTLPTQFRSLMSAIVGGPENRDGKNLITMVFPDYMNVSSTHIDFQRMNEKTKVFINTILDPMLLHAEELTLTSGVPTGFNRVIRDGIVYIAKSYNQFLYLVVTKYSVDQLTA